jgi:hypothetical protein
VRSSEDHSSSSEALTFCPPAPVFDVSFLFTEPACSILPSNRRPILRTRGERASLVVELVLSAGRLGGQVSTEYLQFAGAMVLLVGILIGSYWFVYVPNRRDDSGGNDRESA